MDLQRRVRLLLMALGLLSLVTGIWGGVVRIGWSFELPTTRLLTLHGPLFVSGFVGTLIALERAAALNRPWAYAAPLLSGVGAVSVLLGAPNALGGTLMALSAAVLLVIFAVVTRGYPGPKGPLALMAFSVFLWLVGNVLWASGELIATFTGWWIGFPVLMIAAERLELARLVQVPFAGRLSFVMAVAILFGGIAWTVVYLDGGTTLLGLGMMTLALWLLVHDLAGRTVREKGLTRFMAVALLAGYAWLAFSGLLAFTYGGVLWGLQYDAILHAVFLGFVMSMIFAHAPIIFPALLGLPVPYRPWFYGHLGLLHFSLALRIAGDLASVPSLREWGGLLNGIALVMFLLATILSSRLRGAPTPAQTSPSPDERAAS